MGWWDDIADKVEGLQTKVVSGATWVWNNATLTNITLGLASYAANTFTGVLKQGMALKEAVPSLYYNPKSLKIVKGMGNLMLGVAPIVLLNSANSWMQNYFRSNDGKDPAWSTTYSTFLIGLTVVNYAVYAITIRQASQSLVEGAFLDTLGPIAFTKGKKLSEDSSCKVEKCTIPRRAKGLLREPFVLLNNELIAKTLDWLIGPPVSTAARIAFMGRYIGRTASLECERHKLESIRHEDLLSLGLTYELTSYLMDEAFKRTIGMPPYAYYRLISHLLILLHVNLAVHTDLRMKKGEKQTITYDPFAMIEMAPRFLFDGIVDILKYTVPKYFKFDENAEPFIPLSTVLQTGTKLIKANLEKRDDSSLSFVEKARKDPLVVPLPPVLYSIDTAIKNPIIALYWPGFKKEAIKYIGWVLTGEYYIKGYKVDKFPNFTAFALNWAKNVSPNVTDTVLMLSNENDFKELILALKTWFDTKHGNIILSSVPEASYTLLRGERRIESPQLALPSQALDEPKVIEMTQEAQVVTAPIKAPTQVKGKELPKKKDNLVEFKRGEFEPKRPKNPSHANNPVAFFGDKKKEGPVLRGVVPQLG